MSVKSDYRQDEKHLVNITVKSVPVINEKNPENN